MSHDNNEKNTYIFDPLSAAEMARLIKQDRMVTQAMGGPLSGIVDPSALHTVLDLGCGPGGWVLDTAFAYPHLEVAGVDISRPMIDYANARARTQRRTNASFGVMNITEPFDFPDDSFELVNARYMLAVLKKDAWPPFLAECHRVLRPGGLLRLTEPAQFGVTTSDAINAFMDLILKLLVANDYAVSERSPTILPQLRRWMYTQGYQQIRLLAHALDFSGPTAAWPDTRDDIRIVGVQMEPLLLALGLITEQAFGALFQKVFIDLHQEEFSGLSHWTTIIGQKPSR
ncbi:hypothetical protein KSF_106350 [Reticulibacter mediterranei]|uniref:Methyltransferase domain-containing protein n=1 Tax=Reticulibacter mediterranei TaxID=2778369 RepID=A0A8J3J1F3_9CHLR|nr:class I SAM-dependent methyltransferase [Reticulibacter mediterranei]GHP00588.1 hypothetical protein KSF_106350 [Reticulibacter mediterranei]